MITTGQNLCILHGQIQLNTQLDTHFNSADELPTVDPKSQVVIPEIDLEKSV